MAFDKTPWFVGGGAEHSPEVARLLAYAATGGAHGVIAPGDLKVQPLAVPGGAVRVAPGGALIRNAYPGGGQQTYAARNATEEQVAIVETGSAGGRTDLVVARVLDPQYEGQPPADPITFQYARPEVIAGVPANADQGWLDANRSFPAVALARVTLPASTGTVQAGHITDLRRVAAPRLERGQHMGFPGQDSNIPTSAYSGWPLGVSAQVDVPGWATTALVLAHLSGIEATGTGQTVAGIRTYVGPGQQPGDAAVGRELGENGIIVDPGGSGSRRHHVTIAGRHDVRRYAGQRVWIMTQGLRSAGTGNFQGDYQSTISVEWTFLEEPV